MCDIVFFLNKNVWDIVKRQRLELLCENLLGTFNFVSMLLLFIVLVGNACNEDKYKVGQTILNFICVNIFIFGKLQITLLSYHHNF